MHYVIFLLSFLLIGAQPIKVGILHSLSGTMAQSEKPVVEATLLAIKEINEQGGVLKRPLEPVIFDGKSDPKTFAQGALQLITQDRVAVIFGCWTSASRKLVKEIVENYEHLLFYPVQYEGYEMSPHIIYTGSAPNQQIIPGVTWAFFHLGKKFFIVGSDYIFPRKASEIMKELLHSLGGEIVGEEYIPLGSREVHPIIEKIVDKKPDVIINTINGDTNDAFFRVLREEKHITPEEIPTLSFSLVESELMHLNKDSLIGDYAVWSYFHSIDNPINANFVKKLPHLRISDPMEAAYLGVHLWAKGAMKGDTVDPKIVKEMVKELPYNAPEGMIHVDRTSQHTFKFVRIGKMRGNNNYEILESSDQAIVPKPFPFQ